MTPLPQPVLAPQAPSDEVLRVAIECGATLYRNRINPSQPAVAFGDESWAKFALALGRTAPPADPKPAAFLLRRRMPGYEWRAWTVCSEEDHVAVQEQSMHWGMECESMAVYAAPVSAAVAAPEASPDDIRALGWSVAVHNDYRLNGEACTFWLFTKDGRAVKGEGRTDAEALNKVRAAVAAPTGARTEEQDSVHPASGDRTVATRAPLSEPCALDQGARPVRLSAEQVDGGCNFAGPGRGDCEHFVGLPGRSTPGQHDGPDDTVDRDASILAAVSKELGVEVKGKANG